MRGSVHITHHVRCEEVESGSASSSSGVAMIKSPLRVVVVQDEHFRASEKHFRARVAARNGLVLDRQSPRIRTAAHTLRAGVLNPCPHGWNFPVGRSVLYSVLRTLLGGACEMRS